MRRPSRLIFAACIALFLGACATQNAAVKLPESPPDTGGARAVDVDEELGGPKGGQAAPERPGKDGRSYTKISPRELMDILKEEGYSPSLRGDSKDVILVKMDGLNVLFFFADNRKSIQAYAGFKGDSVPLSRINEWNRNMRFSRAYLDDEKDPVIELDLDLEGGIQRKNISAFFRLVRASVLKFREHIWRQ